MCRTGCKPNMLHVRESECDIWGQNQGPKQSKLASKPKKMKSVGVLDDQKAIQYYNADKHTIKAAHNAAFNEHEPLRDSEIITNVPGSELEREQKEDSNLQNSKEDGAETKGDQPVNEDPNRTELTSSPNHPRPLQRAATGNLDYCMLYNPAARRHSSNLRRHPMLKRLHNRYQQSNKKGKKQKRI